MKLERFGKANQLSAQETLGDLLYVNHKKGTVVWGGIGRGVDCPTHTVDSIIIDWQKQQTMTIISITYMLGWLSPKM